MGVFKAVGFPEDVGRFYRWTNMKAIALPVMVVIPQYTGMVGRCSSFCTLGLFVVHNGEISSYDANQRAIEMYGTNVPYRRIQRS